MRPPQIKNIFINWHNTAFQTKMKYDTLFPSIHYKRKSQDPIHISWERHTELTRQKIKWRLELSLPWRDIKWRSIELLDVSLLGKFTVAFCRAPGQGQGPRSSSKHPVRSKLFPPQGNWPGVDIIFGLHPHPTPPHPTRKLFLTEMGSMAYFKTFLLRWHGVNTQSIKRYGQSKFGK